MWRSRLRRQRNAISAERFCAVERGVGGLQQFRRRHAVLRQHGQADRDGARAERSLEVLRGGCAYLRPDFLCTAKRIDRVGLDQDDGEFLAPYRQTRSSLRVLSCSACPIAASIASPAACPLLSLKDLK